MSMHAMSDQSGVYRFFSGVHRRAQFSQKLIKELATTTAKELSKLNKELAEDTARGEDFLASICENGYVFGVEVEEEVTSNLLEAEQSLAEAIAMLQDKKDSAICDSDLFGHNEDIVIEAYGRSIELMSSLASVTQSIRWTLMEHSEDYAKESSEEMSGDELIASLG